jgi:hypothetical protein
MGEDSCADSAGSHPEAGCELAGHLEVTDVLTVLLVIYFMFLPFSWVKTAVQTMQGRPHPEAGGELAGHLMLTAVLMFYFLFTLFSYVLMGEDSCADSAGPHPEAGGELAGPLEVTVLFFITLCSYRSRG